MCLHSSPRHSLSSYASYGTARPLRHWPHVCTCATRHAPPYWDVRTLRPGKRNHSEGGGPHHTGVKTVRTNTQEPAHVHTSTRTAPRLARTVRERTGGGDSQRAALGHTGKRVRARPLGRCGEMRGDVVGGYDHDLCGVSAHPRAPGTARLVPCGSCRLDVETRGTSLALARPPRVCVETYLTFTLP